MVKMAFMDDRSNPIAVKECPACETVMRGDTTRGSVCPACSASLETAHTTQALQLPNMKSIRRDRITADEEERLRRGFKISHTYIPGHKIQTLTIQKDNSAIGNITFERNADLFHVNMGPYASLESPDRKPGFSLCKACGNWLSPKQIEKHYDSHDSDRCYRGGEQTDLLPQIQLFVEGKHDVVTFELVEDLEKKDKLPYAATLLYALQRGICLALDLDSSELDGFLQHTGDGKQRVVIYEKAEGGTGTLQSILNVDAVRQIANHSLELLHYHPDGLEMEDHCERACYDCLCTFYNQREHKNLNRSLICETILMLKDATVLTGVQSQDDRYREMYEASNKGEREVLGEAADGWTQAAR